jgi:predicted ester cyclase
MHKSNLDTFTRWIDAVNAGDTSVIDDVVGDGIVDHHLPAGIPPGREGVRQWVAMLIESLQLRLDVQDTVVQGDLIAWRAICSGTHVGDYLGFPATDRSFKCELIAIERFENGRVVERWEQVDNAAVMQQLAG